MTNVNWKIGTLFLDAYEAQLNASAFITFPNKKGDIPL